MTLLVLAIALVLPAGFNIAIDNLNRLASNVSDSVQVSVYLSSEASDTEGEDFARVLSNWSEVDSAQYISAEDALNSLKGTKALEDVIEHLPENPLPAVIAVTLSDGSLTKEAIFEVQQRVNGNPLVDQTRVDMDWLKKIQSIVNLVAIVGAGLSLILAIGVILVVGNTIKLAIDARRDEIIVTKLVGATSTFIRRPFLYMGVWLGLASALIAWLILALCMFALTNYIGTISEAYSTDISLQGLDFIGIFQLLIFSTSLGWIGAWVAASQQIRVLEPQ